jgi:hypothetical protein
MPERQIIDMKTKIFVLLITAVAIGGCYYDNEEELYNCSVDPATVKFSTTVNDILTSYGCLGCHSGAAPSGNINLSKYPAVKTVADNGKLYGAITHAAGFQAMPQGTAKMNACDIKKLKAWLDAGAPNN